MAPPRKSAPVRVVTGPYCDRCNRPIVGPAIEVGFRDRCVSCLLRCNVLINYAIWQQQLSEKGDSCNLS